MNLIDLQVSLAAGERRRKASKCKELTEARVMGFESSSLH